MEAQLLLSMLAANGPAPRGESSLFGLGVVIWVGVFLIAGIWARRAVRGYVDLYRTKVEPELPTYDEIAERSQRAPATWFSEAPRLWWRLNRIAATAQTDAELEVARRRMLRRRRISLAVLVLGALAPIVLTQMKG